MNSMIDEGHVHNIRPPVTIGEPERKRIEQVLIDIHDKCPGVDEEIDRIRLIIDPPMKGGNQ